MDPLSDSPRDPLSPYWQGGSTPRTMRSLVAFLDILGFKDRMRDTYKKEDSAPNRLLRELREALSASYAHLSPMWALELPDARQWDVKTFTDCVVIGYPFEKDGEGELGHTFGLIGAFQLEMVSRGFFVRGGIAVGEAYMDRDIVFGDALIEAYEAESAVARDPRVVLARSARELAENHLRFYADPTDAPHNVELLRDTDNQVFLDYLATILLPDSGSTVAKGDLRKHKRQIEGALQTFKDRPAIWSKYQWVAGYHDYFCGIAPGARPEDRIDAALSKAGPRSFVELPAGVEARP
jgi:hypothetical protein